MDKKQQGGIPAETAQSQYEKFKDAAREKGCEDVDEAELDKRMKKLASLPSDGRKKKVPK